MQFQNKKIYLRIKYVKTQWLKSGEWGCPLDNGSDLAVGQPISS